MKQKRFTLIVLLLTVACARVASFPGDTDETASEGESSSTVFDVGAPMTLPRAGELWGPCAQGLTCDEPGSCLALDVGPDLHTMCVPSNDFADCIGALEVQGPWCVMSCTEVDDCAPEWGLLCSPSGACVWQGATT